MSAGLLTLTLAVAAPVPAGLQKGDTFTFTGSVAEAVERPGDRFRRNHDLELRVFVLDHHEKWADVAVLTRLKRTDDAVAGAAGALTGNAAPKDAPPLIRLDLVRVHADGTAHLLAPPGPAPLRLNADTPARALPLIPLDAFAPSEFGVFPSRPPHNSNGEPWTVAVGPSRPSETWQEKGFEFQNAERCQYLVMNQMSANWLKPVGGERAWHRAEAVWVSTRDGTARKVHRVVRQRDGLAEAPSAWVEVKYELKGQARLNGQTFDRTRRDVEVAYVALNEPVTTLSPKQIETRLAKLDAHLKESDPTGAYREALVAARRTLEAAGRGEVAPVQPPPPPPMVPAWSPARAQWPEPGQPAPDVRAGNFRLAEQTGKPVVLVFLKPGGETTDLSLAVADALEKRYAGKVAVVPLVVFGEVAAAVKARDRLKLTVRLNDGATAATAYGVETVPRFAVIDAAGKVRWTFTGIGGETGFLVKEQVDRLVNPASPDGAAGTTPAPGAGGAPPIPRR